MIREAAAHRCNTQHRSTARLVFVPGVAEWALGFISCGLTHHFLLRGHHAAKERLGMGDLDMVDIAKIVLFILACAFLFSLTAFLFRDQITSRRR